MQVVHTRDKENSEITDENIKKAKIIFGEASLFGKIRGRNVFDTVNTDSAFNSFNFANSNVKTSAGDLFTTSPQSSPKEIPWHSPTTPKSVETPKKEPRNVKNSTPKLDTNSPFVDASPPRKKRKHQPDTPKRSKSQPMLPQPSFWSQPHMPTVISGYVQVFFNLSILSLILYLAVIFIKTVHRDVSMKSEEYSAEITQQIFHCNRLYQDNRCAKDLRVPAMEKQCIEWELCMNRDPKDVGQLKIGAETVAEILNKLIEPLSTKTMAFLSIFTFGTLFVSNMAFAMFRSRAAPISQPFTPTTPHFFPPGSPYSQGSPYSPPSYILTPPLLEQGSPSSRSPRRVRKGPLARVLHGWSPSPNTSPFNKKPSQLRFTMKQLPSTDVSMSSPDESLDTTIESVDTFSETSLMSE